MPQKSFIMVKAGILESKTSCFTMCDSSDREFISITLHSPISYYYRGKTINRRDYQPLLLKYVSKMIIIAFRLIVLIKM